MSNVCPFYGFNAVASMRLLVPSGGNQCALITNAISPCRRELAGVSPNWALCPLNRPGSSAEQFMTFQVALFNSDPGASPYARD